MRSESKPGTGRIIAGLLLLLGPDLYIPTAFTLVEVGYGVACVAILVLGLWLLNSGLKASGYSDLTDL